MDTIKERQMVEKPAEVFTRRGALKRIAALGLMASYPSILLSPGVGRAAAIDDLSDSWNIHETTDHSARGGSLNFDAFSCTIRQAGTSLSVVTPYATFAGTKSGTAVSWTGQYTDPKTGESVTIDAMSLVLSPDGNTLSGSYTWTRSAGSTVYSGTTDVQATRQPAGLPAGYSSLYVSCYSSDYSSTYHSGFYYSCYGSGYYSQYCNPYGSLYYYSYHCTYRYRSYGSCYQSGGYSSVYPSTYTSGSGC